MTTPNPTSARRSLRAAGRDPEHQRRQDNFAHARRRCLQKEQQQQQSCDLTMVDPVLDGSTAPPAAGRLRNNRRKNDPMVNTAPPAEGRPRDHRRENSPRAAARVNSGRGAIAACAPPTAAEAPAAVCALADLPAPERLPASERPEIETLRAVAREMAAIREEMAALREEVAALLAALTSPDSSPPLYGLHPSEAKVPRGIPPKASCPPTAQVPRGTTHPNSSPPRDCLHPSEAPVARGVPSKASCPPTLPRSREAPPPPTPAPRAAASPPRPRSRAASLTRPPAQAARPRRRPDRRGPLGERSSRAAPASWVAPSSTPPSRGLHPARHSGGFGRVSLRGLAALRLAPSSPPALSASRTTDTAP